jgi:hypothetical protein
MPSVLALKQEYKRMHPHSCDEDAQGAAYMAMREELVRQTLTLKENIFYGRDI